MKKCHDKDPLTCNNEMVMARTVALFNFKFRQRVLVEYSHPKRYNSREKILLKKYFLVNNLRAAT